MFPVSSASFFLSKFKIMQRNLLLGLQAGPALPTSRTWPGAGEATLLRLVGLIWSTSDFAHQVSTAASLLLAQYIGQCRVRNAVDIAAGLFLCSVSAQYESFSKRLVPEVVNFLSRSITTLILGNPDLAQGGETTTYLDKLVDTKSPASDRRPDILAILSTGKITRASRQQLCIVALDLSAEIYTRQTSLLSFEECFAPLAQALDRVAADVPASPLKVSSSLIVVVSRQYVLY